MAAIELIPSAKRLITSLRDLGYDFSQAVADIVDNSIEAGASLVAIDVEFDGDDSWVRIADNGKGMKPEQLREAMRYGAMRDYKADDLGKFGLGLKTASMSQCKCLSVASRSSPERADIAAYSWDLDHIEDTNRWEILPFQRNGLAPTIRQPLKDTTGTVVLWQRLDRILGYTHPYGEFSRKRLSQTCRDVEVHLGMVFHRFLTGEVRRKRFKLLLNGNDVEPWDPFARAEPKTKVLTPVNLELEHEGVKGEVKLEPFVLPHKDDFSSPEAFKRASGPSNWNQQQGFYIYRAGRLIQSGGWCRLRIADEHTKLARVALSFSPALDQAFKINVAKMRVQLPPQIRDLMEQATRPLIKIARDTYDKKGSTYIGAPALSGIATSVGSSPLVTGGSTPLASLADDRIANDTRRDSPSRLWTLDDLQPELENVAEPDERPVIAKVFSRFREVSDD